MPFTPEMRRKVDQIRDYLYGGGYPDPLSNAEQLSWLFFFNLVEGQDAQVVRQAAKEGKDSSSTPSIFEGQWTLRNPINEPAQGVRAIERARLRWSQWANDLSGTSLVEFVRWEVFPFYEEISQQRGLNALHQARLVIDEPTVLAQILALIGELGLSLSDADTKGELFEHVLRQIKQAGELGQFLTPRHITQAIVEMVDPKMGETVYDPAAGTGGFLVAAHNHIRLANSARLPEQTTGLGGPPLTRSKGSDNLTAPQGALQRGTLFFGSDVDANMVSLACMNLALRDLPGARVIKRNPLTSVLDAQSIAQLALPPQGFDVILANPPFSGKIDRTRICAEVKVGNTSSTELLFLKHIIESLNAQGRCGVIVPEGVLFGSTRAHKALRQMLLQGNTLEAVVSLPSGVFEPYSGVKTSILLLRKGGHTEQVLFLSATNDGFKLDSNHDQPIEANDLPGLIAAFKSKSQRWAQWQKRDCTSPWTQNWWFATNEAIELEDWCLCAPRYRPQGPAVDRQALVHPDPRELLTQLQTEVEAILQDIKALSLNLTPDQPE